MDPPPPHTPVQFSRTNLHRSFPVLLRSCAFEWLQSSSSWWVAVLHRVSLPKAPPIPSLNPPYLGLIPLPLFPLPVTPWRFWAPYLSSPTLRSAPEVPRTGSIRMAAHHRRRGGPTPLQTKVTIEGKNEIYNWENLAGLFLVHKLLAPPPPSPPSNTSLPWTVIDSDLCVRLAFLDDAGVMQSQSRAKCKCSCKCVSVTVGVKKCKRTCCKAYVLVCAQLWTAAMRKGMDGGQPSPSMYSGMVLIDPRASPRASARPVCACCRPAQLWFSVRL